ncbi:hypothetical protein HPB48_018746 [Haemaphysalis longicornis]|uniref:Intraflagellar transport protein 20 n=1 Tax=Haemaphysalis longicornis TaxID=44386 RepID=A0A9J6GRZ3_HAELO|nr:hypothetical protein HPB48_018746 [Haemaphysalis longicornis]
MANEVFLRAGLYIDELNKIRIADPEATRQTQELKDDCHKFIERMTEFQSVVDKYIAISDKLAAEVEQEKLKAIGSRSLLKSVAKDREMHQQQLQALVLEKKIELESSHFSFTVTQGRMLSVSKQHNKTHGGVR